MGILVKVLEEIHPEAACKSDKSRRQFPLYNIFLNVKRKLKKGGYENVHYTSFTNFASCES